MKKTLLTLLIILFSSSLFAEVNEPGAGKINYFAEQALGAYETN